MTISEDCVISEKWSWFESLAFWHTACSHQVSQLWDALTLLVLGLLSLNVIGIRAKSLAVLWAKGFQIKWHFELKIGNQNGNFCIYEENLKKVKYFHWFWRPRTCELSSLCLIYPTKKLGVEVLTYPQECYVTGESNAYVMICWCKWP